MNAASLQQLKAQAMQLHRAGQLDAAKTLYFEILQRQPGNADALHLFGLVCHQQGDHETAVRYISQAVEQVPAQPVLRNNLGDAMHKAGDLAGAIEQLRHAVALRADYAGAHMNLGAVLAESGDHDEAMRHSLEATRLDPQRAEAWFNLGLLQLDHVLLVESVASLRKALALRPDYSAAANSLLYVLNLTPGMDPAEVAQEHRRVASGLFGRIRRATTWPKPSERIRIGYVSGDFCAHAVNYFFEPVLEHQDSTRFETFCYSDVTQVDAVTERLRGLAQHWRDVAGLPDEALAEQIRADAIDILVDLAGYTKHGRLGVFAAKPARCQVSYIGYPNTTGLEAMDARVVDHCTAPADETPVGTESLLRLANGFACFRPPSHVPTVTVAPVSSNGFITFGSLHKLEKLNAGVIETWAQILAQNPDSRLLLARDQLDSWHQNRLTGVFAEFGIGTERLEMIHLTDPSQSFFELFSRMDILLDAFPWSGHTIACCALWMGVPVVTLRGNTHAGRMVASVLEGLGLSDLIAGDIESYLRAASNLCRDQARIATLREEVRQRMQSSPLRDEAGFTKAFESAIRMA
ncbi:MAG TPA: tetratricopeptide repeat protein [Dokdonella sp.]|uniref:O-linked N-acetylglucosamine transferase, SPINDLY family protein n=1 Tax=Dokdonella sp. TaxID=2291710 RepID=UPI002D7FA6EC|nr:tetratricopeptide repeat protein [Dokdonella sp.]HET9033968.1 tetratricopeptide repeat protein [Dokdonella sp.]